MSTRHSATQAQDHSRNSLSRPVAATGASNNHDRWSRVRYSQAILHKVRIALAPFLQSIWYDRQMIGKSHDKPFGYQSILKFHLGSEARLGRAARLSAL